MVDIQQLAPGLSLDAEGIWHARRAAEVSYPEEGHGLCFQVEDQSFWFQHRNRCISPLIEGFPPPGGGAIFDIGGGNGCVAAALQRRGHDVVLIEPGPAGVRNARRRGVRQVVCATLEEAGFAPGTLPAAGLFDVLEHIPDDRAFLGALRSQLAPGGRLYLTVPAYGWLWSDEDVSAGHFRRYTAASLTAALRAAGFRVDFLTYFFRFLPLPVFLLRTLPSRLKLQGKPQGAASAAQVSRDHAAGTGPGKRVLDALLAAEVGNIARKAPMRFGGSLLVAASRGEEGAQANP